MSLDPSREKLREILNKRRLPFATADVTDRNKKAWLACSTKAQSDEELARKRATYLSSLVCRASVDQKYVSSGIYRNVVAKSPIFLFQSLETGHFARSLILASGKFCPGADELDEKIKERLREIASTGPAK